MAKVSKRESMLKSESLAQRFRDAEEAEPQSVYKPVRNTNSDFLAAVDDALAKEDSPSTKTKSGGNLLSTLFILILVIVFLALCVGGFIFAKSNGLINL